jgi:hypothetical protein
MAELAGARVILITFSWGTGTGTTKPVMAQGSDEFLLH